MAKRKKIKVELTLTDNASRNFTKALLEINKRRKMKVV